MVKKRVDLEEKQAELPEMPAASPIGKAARAYLKVCDEIDETNEKLEKKKEDAKAKILDLLTAENLEFVMVDGYKFNKVHVDARDDIRVSKKKKSVVKDAN